jgi:hypothetical protein
MKFCKIYYGLWSLICMNEMADVVLYLNKSRFWLFVWCRGRKNKHTPTVKSHNDTDRGNK